eukprot:2778762-Amphidinium_carterae.1
MLVPDLVPHMPTARVVTLATAQHQVLNLPAVQSCTLHCEHHVRETWKLQFHRDSTATRWATSLGP